MKKRIFLKRLTALLLALLTLSLASCDNGGAPVATSAGTEPPVSLTEKATEQATEPQTQTETEAATEEATEEPYVPPYDDEHAYIFADNNKNTKCIR